MFAGSFSEVMASPVFRESFLRDFVGSIPELNPEAYFVALGHTACDALDWCVDNSHLGRDRFLGALAHPSTSGGSAVKVYLGSKSILDLNPNDPVRRRAARLQADALRMKRATVLLRSERYQGSVAAIASPAVVVATTTLSHINTSMDFHVTIDTPKPKRSISGRTKSANFGISSEMLQAFADAGYFRTHETSKVDQFSGRRGSSGVYVKKGKAISIVVHPDAKSRALFALQNLGTIGVAYHSSNMTDYPKRMHAGKSIIPYGYPVTFKTAGALRKFLIAFDGQN
jgi:hypothetical protein